MNDKIFLFITKVVSIKQDALSMYLLNYAYNILVGKELDSSDVIYGKYGKPYLKKQEFYFSISHSGIWAVCAIYKKEIGVDVQVVKESKQDFFTEFYSKSEIQTFGDDVRKLTAVWTIKESYYKQRGTGLGDNIDSLVVASINPTITLLHGKKVKDVIFYTFSLDNTHILSICI